MDFRILYDSWNNHHGIHHGLNEDRANNIVRIMESIDEKKVVDKNYDEINTAALIPIKGELINFNKQYLLKNTIDKIKDNNIINEIIVSTDNSKTADIAESLGASKIIIRPSELSKNYVGVADVIKFTLEEYEKIYPKLDLIIFLEETYPFRDKNEISHMIHSLLKQGNDSLIAVKNESKGAWMKDENNLTPIIEQTFMPRDLKSKSIDIAQIGYCTILRPEYVRFGDILGPDVALYNIKKKLNCIEVRNNIDMEEYLELLESK